MLVTNILCRSAAPHAVAHREAELASAPCRWGVAASVVSVSAPHPVRRNSHDVRANRSCGSDSRSARSVMCGGRGRAGLRAGGRSVRGGAVGRSDARTRHPLARGRCAARRRRRQTPGSPRRSCTTRRRSSSSASRASAAACRWGNESSEINIVHSGFVSDSPKLLPKAAARHPADAVSHAAPRADGNGRMPQGAVPRVKKRIGFLSFGHWHPSSQSRTNTGRDALVQAIELAIAAEELGIDGAFYRVHHFARQLAAPFPLLAAIGARTTPHRDRHRRHRHALREPAVHGRGGRGGRPHQRARRRRGPPAARRQPRVTRDGAATARSRSATCRRRARPTPTSRARRPSCSGPRSRAPGVVAAEPADDRHARATCRSSRSRPGLADRIWWGSGTRATAEWTAEQGMNLMSSTLLTEDTGVPFDQLQAEQIAALPRRLGARPGWEREPRVSVSAAASSRS